MKLSAEELKKRKDKKKKQIKKANNRAMSSEKTENRKAPVTCISYGYFTG